MRFTDPVLDSLEQSDEYAGCYLVAVVRGYRKVMQVIRAATDERDLRGMRSLNFEKLVGDREGQHSFRLNGKWRLIVTIEKATPKNTVVVIEIVDYH